MTELVWYASFVYRGYPVTILEIVADARFADRVKRKGYQGSWLRAFFSKVRGRIRGKTCGQDELVKKALKVKMLSARPPRGTAAEGRIHGAVAHIEEHPHRCVYDCIDENFQGRGFVDRRCGAHLSFCTSRQGNCWNA